MTTDHQLVSTLCPICHYTLSSPFLDGGHHPLVTLGWPASSEAARTMPCHPHDYVQCPRCTHVWNRSFTYDAIPYENNPMRMFNKGTIWQGHLATTRHLLLSHLPTSPTVIDIGCGEGHFVRGLADAMKSHGRFVGFDLNTTHESGRGVEFYARYFEPKQDIPTWAPDMVIMRHVIEHLTDPAAFVEQLAWGASHLDKPVLFFSEMPCIDKAITSKRLVDFFYEHPSHFTTQSFRTLMERAGDIIELNHGYDGEVIYALVRLRIPDHCHATARSAAEFFDQAPLSRQHIIAQMNDLIASGKQVAIWGGTGKSAAFIHQYQADARSFPLVVDSDIDKVGTFVPGTGQLIQFRDILKNQPIDVVIIPAQWRARDIVAEMERESIAATEILIEHDGRLINFKTDSHPYH